MSGRPAYLALADGTVFNGTSYGAAGSAVGEAVFTTGMTGYQEVLTDPSYTGQIVTMTAPHIGNTGINDQDGESLDGKPQVAGFVLRASSPLPSNWRHTSSLADYLNAHGIVAITDLDTRRLTRYLRDHGAQNACIGSEAPDTLVDRARAAPSMAGLDLVARVTSPKAFEFTESSAEWRAVEKVSSPERPHVVAYDFGAKRNILRCLVDTGFRVTVVPAATTAQEALALAPDGIFLSNGPGDPAALTSVIDTLRELLGKRPIFGICLGHQLLALALGASTYKLKFGHRGLNQPVKNLNTGRVEITTQNHGFVVDVESISKLAKTTHLHLNDGTSEGLEAPEARAFSVQFHPEAAAGPHDALNLFAHFREQL